MRFQGICRRDSRITIENRKRRMNRWKKFNQLENGLQSMGEVSFPSGEILVRDPLVWLRKDEKPYLQSVPVGRYKLETLVIKIEEEHDRYMATRVKFTDKKPIIYQEALRGMRIFPRFKKVVFLALK